MTQVAVQMYTLREFCKTPADIAKTLKRVADIGYQAIQASAMGPIDPKELRQILDDNGLVCCATHRSFDMIKNHTAALIDEHHTIGCAYVALGAFFPKPEDYSTATWTAFIEDFNTTAKNFEGSGIKLGYHNHSHEFAPLGEDDPRTAWDLLCAKLSADCWLEVDTYWIQHGGGDPAAWIEHLAGRVPCVHLKDMSIGTDRTHRMREVGSGNMNWERILDACKIANTRWHIIEQDNCNGMDPFACLKTSLEFVKTQGLS